MTATALAKVVEDLDEAEYHAHAALSVSGAKKLLAPSCPARFKWERDNPPAPKAVFDIGHAAHAAVLGVGADVVVVDAANWMTKAAKEARDQAYADGKTPLLAADAAAVEGMAAALRAHPKASALLDPDHGTPEVSLFWTDVASTVQRRARLDWLPATDGGRLTIVDYKTCASAEPGKVRKAVADFGYHMQHAWYVDGAHAVGLAEDVGFRFVFQEKTPPYLITVVELDAEAVRVGRARNDEALRVFAECTEWDTWPGYADDVQVLSLPPWAQPRQEFEQAF